MEQLEGDIKKVAPCFSTPGKNEHNLIFLGFQLRKRTTWHICLLYGQSTGIFNMKMHTRVSKQF